MIVARRYVITGRVQGVGYRFFVSEAARVEGLHGWVENRPDGAVEARVEGDRESVIRFERQLRRGPSHARVEEVQAFDEAPAGSHGFIVRR
ncbi:MAG TPA: acylphosphatase [Vicinamibacterales bacterium]|nr:acylphosphatase [Vicinamibacterales bacterium]